MKTDAEIQHDVLAELKWEPHLKSAEVGVAVKNGIVTLSGHVETFVEKKIAEKAAKRVAGVKIVAEDIQVGISPDAKKSDTEIAEAILSALNWHSGVREEKIKISVEDGNVRLEGEVDWDYERNNAGVAVEHIAGVRSVLNLITIKPQVSAPDIKEKITAALVRSATIDASKITVAAQGTKITLSGRVRSHAEKEDAERIAWAAPGITTVDNNIEVALPSYAYAE
jgi:osmotically-inducible protein OsmY